MKMDPNMVSEGTRIPTNPRPFQHEDGEAKTSHECEENSEESSSHPRVNGGPLECKQLKGGASIEGSNSQGDNKNSTKLDTDIENDETATLPSFDGPADDSLDDGDEFINSLMSDYNTLEVCTNAPMASRQESLNPKVLHNQYDSIAAAETTNGTKGMVTEGATQDIVDTNFDGGGKSGVSSYGDFSSSSQNNVADKEKSHRIELETVVNSLKTTLAVAQQALEDYEKTQMGNKSNKKQKTDKVSSPNDISCCTRKQLKDEGNDEGHSHEKRKNRKQGTRNRNLITFEKCVEKYLPSIKKTLSKIEQEIELPVDSPLRRQVGDGEINILNKMHEIMLDMEGGGYPLNEYIKDTSSLVLEKSRGKSLLELMILEKATSATPVPRYCRVCPGKVKLEGHICPYCKICYIKSKGKQRVLHKDCSVDHSVVDSELVFVLNEL